MQTLGGRHEDSWRIIRGTFGRDGYNEGEREDRI